MAIGPYFAERSHAYFLGGEQIIFSVSAGGNR